MITSQQMSLLSDLKEKPIPESTLAYFRARLRNRLHALVLEAFIKQSEEKQLTQLELAERIGRAPEQVNRWLGAAGNWTLDTISDLMVGIGIDLDDPSYTPIVDLVDELRDKRKPDATGRKRPTNAGPTQVPVSKSARTSRTRIHEGRRGA
jgi:DNA-binding phage protein